jgi:anionic cell wall polymer biosynthesis LytR-Cps2A-Psr (LCP) family protein
MGGIDMAIDTVEHFLNIEIDHWAAINLDGFRDLVNVLGGLHINAEKDMYHHYVNDNIVINIKQGETVLNGDEALYYVRFRKDAEGDFGRNRRQQQVIKAMLDQTLTMRNVTKVGEIIDVIGDNFRTDIPANKMLSMVRQFATLSGDDIETLRIEGEPGYLDGTAYVFIDEAERLRIQRELKARLHPEKVSHMEQAGQTQGDQY